MGADPSSVGSCAGCGSSIEQGQRYCLVCGERIGSRSPELTQLLQRVRDQPEVQQQAPLASPLAPVPRSRLSLPSPRISVLLVSVFLGFGVILGISARSPIENSQAASEQAHLDLLLPQRAQASTPPAPISEPTSPPPVISEPTPEPKSEPEPESPSASSTPSEGSSTKKGSSKSKNSSSKSTSESQGGSQTKLPPIKHVFVIMLSEEPYASVFGPSSQAPYLAHTLEKKGELLVRYYAVAHAQLAGEIALLSGQGPTEATDANCPTYTEITPATSASEEQVRGAGCAYPGSTRTLMNELIAKQLTWKAYIQGTDEGGSTPPVCSHPVLGASDPTATATSGPYATFINPFVYFESMTGSSECKSKDVGISELKGDLADAKQTANFSYIAPDLCHDGNPTPCQAGAPAGIPAADEFLQSVVPEILASKAYKENGLLVITTDQAPSQGEGADSSSCCGQPSFPNLPAPTSTALAPRGGGQVGALMLSPYVKAAQVNQEPFNHFSLLRTIEDLFGLEHIGYAGASAVKSFTPSMFTSSK